MAAYNKHIIISGSARSGTSWLSESIARQHRYRLLFEPEHEFNTKKGVLICDRLITAATVTPATKGYMKKIFRNRVDNDWIAQHSNRKFKRHLWPFIPKKLVIKFVRAALSVPYMHQAFGIPVIHIIRDPYAVISSQQRVRFPWLYDLSRFQAQEELVALVMEHFHIDIGNTRGFSEPEILCLRWCLENAVPLKLMPTHSASFLVVSYEKLRGDLDLFREICRDFDLDPAPNIAEQFLSPSSKTHPNSEWFTGNPLQQPWSASEKEGIEYLLQTFHAHELPIP